MVKGVKSRSEIVDYLKTNKYRIHHAPDGQTLQLIPAGLHKLTHSGGVSVIKNQ